MKTIKPLKLGVCHRPMYENGRHRLVVSVMALFPLDAPTVLLPEVNLWKLVGDAMPDRPVLDEWFPKSRGELLVTGSACPPGGEGRVCKVRVRLARVIDKTLAVFGNRYWGARAATDPAPFREMPITWAHAFGGKGYAHNPLGKGAVEVTSEHGAVFPLPNVEDPRTLVLARDDRPPPAGFGAYDVTWPQRASKRGTYGDKWQRDQYPGFPADLDSTFFNVAPQDQQIAGYFAGDEPLRIENMHPDKPLIESRLPGIAGRAFVRRCASAQPQSDALEEVRLVLDTVHLFPTAERGIVIFRGAVDVVDDAASDLSHLVIAADVLGAPRPISHYATALAQRLDAKKGHMFALRSRDLLPERPSAAHPGERYSDMGELVAKKGLIRANMRRGANAQLAAARGRLVEHGQDPQAYALPECMPEDEPVPDIEELAEHVERIEARAEASKSDADAKRAAGEASSRELCAAHGVDYDKMMAHAQNAGAGPPKSSAEAKLEEIRATADLARNAGVATHEVDALLADPGFVAALREGAERQIELYRKFAHAYPAAPRLDAERAARLREEVRRAHAAGESFWDRDLTGADLSAMDLRGGDFDHAFLENAYLRDVDLSEASLGGAVLARADLTGAKLVRSNLEGANLGASVCTGADFSEARLAHAMLMKADMTGAILRGADLGSATLLEVVLTGANLDGARAPAVTFVKLDLTGASFVGAELSKTPFVECNLTGVDFSNATLVKATFVTCKADGSAFRKANLEGASFPKDTTLERADFGGARAPCANFRGARLAGANFAEALLDGADLSDASLQGARLYRAVCKGALFIRADLRDADLTSANLTSALFQYANIRAATFKGANLFRADMAFIDGDRGTSFEGALMGQIRFVERRSPADMAART